jgi:hypothetical protein
MIGLTQIDKLIVLAKAVSVVDLISWPPTFGQRESSAVGIQLKYLTSESEPNDAIAMVVSSGKLSSVVGVPITPR